LKARFINFGLMVRNRRQTNLVIFYWNYQNVYTTNPFVQSLTNDAVVNIRKLKAVRNRTNVSSFNPVLDDSLNSRFQFIQLDVPSIKWLCGSVIRANA
jgi:hypothetical protein